MATYPPLTPEEAEVILRKDTEMPNSGRYNTFFSRGLYACRQCAAPLYRSDDKFSCGCGWPAFDNTIKGAVKEVPDADGRRTEIVCANCGGHLGHVFRGEKLTPNNERHCVNSLSLRFEGTDSPNLRRLFVAGGCFWGVEYFMMKQPGVLRVTSGYAGGHTEYPTYEAVCIGDTGHLETIEIIYDPSQTDDQSLLKRFFEIHDPTQSDGQGPDLGAQYHSAVFYETDEQKATAEQLIAKLQSRGFEVVTQCLPITRFWPAETYHQDHYARLGTLPYCHGEIKRFEA